MNLLAQKDAKQFYDAGMEKKNKKEFALAVENFSACFKLESLSHEAVYNAALCYYELKEYEKCLSDLKK